MLILLVEDEERIATFVSKGLHAEGYSCVRARDGAQALTLARSESIDLVVLDFDELLARIRALVRRDQASAVELRAGALRLNLREHSASSADGRAELTVRESALLEYFLRHPNHVVTRSQISSGVWPYDSFSDSNVVDVYVGYLRRKVPWPADVRIETVRGAGYRLRVS